MKDIVAPNQSRERSQTFGLRDPQGTSSLLFSNSRLMDVAIQGSGVVVDALRLGDAGITFGRVVSGGHEVALQDPDCVTILIPTQGSIAMETGGVEHRLGSGALVVVEAEKRRTRVTAPKVGPFVATTVLVPRALARSLEEAPSAYGRRAARAVRQVDSALGRQVRYLLPDLAEDVFRQPDRIFSPRAREECIGLIRDLVAESLGMEVSPAWSGGGISEFRRVSRACDIMQARSDEALSLTELAAELEVSPRCLQLSFQSVHGVSPREYLQRVRLDRVRERILSHGDTDTVTGAAMDCGFLHLGRFSQAYRRTFGELPSETIRRRGGRRSLS